MTSGQKKHFKLFEITSGTAHSFVGLNHAVSVTGLSKSSVRALVNHTRPRVFDWCRMDTIPPSLKPKVGVQLKVRSLITGRRYSFNTNEEMMDRLGLSLEEVILIRYRLVDHLHCWTSDE